jgi:hypothetical protein
VAWGVIKNSLQVPFSQPSEDATVEEIVKVFQHSVSGVFDAAEAAKVQCALFTGGYAVGGLLAGDLICYRTAPVSHRVLLGTAHEALLATLASNLGPHELIRYRFVACACSRSGIFCASPQSYVGVCVFRRLSVCTVLNIITGVPTCITEVT